MRLLLSILLFAVVLRGIAPLELGPFTEKPWRGVTVVTRDAPALPPELPPGTPIACWADVVKKSYIGASAFPENLSAYTHLTFWLYSEEANNQILTFYLSSESPETEGKDYYFCNLTINWKGWKHVRLSFQDDFRETRNPKGWHDIQDFTVYSDGWGHEGLPDTTLYFAAVRFIQQALDVQVARDASARSSSSMSCQVLLGNKSNHDIKAILHVEDNEAAMTVSPDIDGKTVRLKAEESRSLKLSLKPRKKKTFPERYSLRITAVDSQEPDIVISRELSLTMPLPYRAHPCLFGDKNALDDVIARANTLEWAKDERIAIIRNAESALKKPVKIPDMEGQWWHHYVCKTCGVSLQYKDKQHWCPKCGGTVQGWPYDQVIATNTHCNYWRQVKIMGQAYLFTGREEFARRGREILLAYAEKYPKFSYHDTRNGKNRKGGRMLAQTLDEASAIIPVAWGYDLLYNSPCFSNDDRDKIENSFLREVARTILRNDMGTSNWQSWHNAGVASIGFCLNDPELIYHAIYDNKNGLLFQFKNSILKDGFWLEGTASYHFYALDALIWTVEAARWAGLDFTRKRAFISMFDAPLSYVMPNMTFPAINDGDVSPLQRYALFYDWAYSRLRKPEYARVAAISRKGDRTLFFGADTLPDSKSVTLHSRNFPALGALVLRQKDCYVHLDYGPHGGGHGHQDKLALTIFAAGELQAPDPGRITYGAPLMKRWYPHSVAHNTVVVDGRSQRSTEGRLLAFQKKDDYCIGQAECTTAYPDVLLNRIVGICDGVVFDVFEVSSSKKHTIDWVYHNFGEWTPKLSGKLEPCQEPPGKNNGYDVIENARQIQLDDSWQVHFKQDRSSGRLVVNGAPGTTLIFGNGVAGNPPAPCPLVIVRRNASETRFAACVDYAAKNAKPRKISLRLLPGHTRQTPRLCLTIDDRTHTIILEK